MNEKEKDKGERSRVDSERSEPKKIDNEEEKKKSEKSMES